VRRLGVDYVDIFYSHRVDPETPPEETMGALDTAVRQGKALYAGISSYPAEETREAVRILRELGTPALVHQPSYSMLDRWIEPDLLGVLREEGLGCVVFSPLAQGLLSGRYAAGVPAGSRASERGSTLPARRVEETRERVRALDAIARRRGQTLAQMALAWVLRDPVVTSALVGVSSVEQLDENLAALDNRAFAPEELAEIDRALA
jgi:L-glyceraldehyde 3-phosphate reductase